MTLSRRRFLSITAAATLATPAQASALHRIRFQALGADCQITLPGTLPEAEQAVSAVRSDLEKVENAFSLYRATSQLVRLNRDGRLANPDPSFLHGLTLARRLHKATDGRFDPTVQALWHAQANGMEPAPVGLVDLLGTENGISFAKPGMAATFNGIAQGIATDRAIAILKAHGYRDVLANLGEFFGLGFPPSGRKWRIGVQNPVTNAIEVIMTPTPNAPAIATSEPRGTLVAGKPHIFDPLMQIGPRWASVTVRSTSAALADGLSTAIAAAPIADAKGILSGSDAVEAILIDAEGKPTRWSA